MPLTFNPYQYALNNPLRYRDPRSTPAPRSCSSIWGILLQFAVEDTAKDVSDYFHGRSRTAEDLADGLTDYAGRAGHSAGYGVGYGVGYALTGPAQDLELGQREHESQ